MRENSILGVVLLVAVGAAPSLARTAGEPLPRSVVAYTGQIAPGTGGANYLLLFQPSITRAGDVLFRSELTGAGTNSTNNRAYFRQDQGSAIGLFLRAGDASPLPGHSWSTSLNDPNAQEIGGAARAGFAWRLNDGGAGKNALWSELPAGLRNVALEGGAAPGIPGATFTSFPSSTFESAFDEAGQHLFSAMVTGGGTTAANDFGLWLDDGTTTSLVLREGDDAPGLPPGSKFPNGFFSPPVLGPGGTVTFVAVVQVAGVPKSGIWSTHGGTLAPLAIEETQIAGLGSGERIGGFSPVVGNRHGRIAFSGPIENSQGGWIAWGIWISDPTGSLSLVYRREAGAAGLDLPPSLAVLGDNGLLHLITTYLVPGGSSYRGIFAVGSGGWRTLVRQGERAAGLNAGVNYWDFDQLVVNGPGRIAFRADLTGPGVSGSNGRILAVKGDSGFDLVARTGESLEVAPGIVRTIGALLLTQPTGVSPGAWRSFADDGTLVWVAGTGGVSSAILVTGAGIPPSVQLVGFEAVQVVQDWNGSVPLVAGKTTIVRAHLESDPPVEVDPILRARPAGGGPELPNSPLRIANQITFDTVVSAEAARSNLEKSAYWDLPPEWTAAGEIELEVELLGREVDCLEAAPPGFGDCRLEALFEAVPAPELRMVAIDYVTGTGTYSLEEAQRVEVVDRILSAMPTSAVTWTGSRVVRPGNDPPPNPACGILDWLWALKLYDGCYEWLGCRTVYHGLLLSTDGSGCAFPDVRVAASYHHSDPFYVGRQVAAHELAHVLGREHTVDPLLPPTPEGRLQGFCGETADPGSPPFPYIHEIDGERRPTLGPLDQGDDAMVFGFDSLQRSSVDPTEVFDLLSYCVVPIWGAWPSKATLEHLRSALETQFPSAPEGAPENGTGGTALLLISGTVDVDTGTGILAPFQALQTPSAPPAPPAGSFTINVHRSGGSIETIPFSLGEPSPVGQPPAVRPFLVPVLDPPTVSAIELMAGTTLLDSRAASAHAPAIQVLSPNGGELLDDPTVTISWAASDADLEPLSFLVQYSADDGTTWRALSLETTDLSLEIDRRALLGTAAGRIRVQVSDGLRTASDASDGSFAVADHIPFATISSPANGSLFHQGQVLILGAVAVDPEDGLISGSALTWSSSVGGALGVGSPLVLPVATLADGAHLVTLTAEDSAGNFASAAIQIHVNQPSLLFEDDFESGGLTLWSSTIP